MSLHDDLLEQATHLAQLDYRRPKQASLRRAVSGAYYALFHLLVAEGTRNVRPSAVRHHVRRVFEHSSMKTVCKAWAIGKLDSISESTRALVTPPIEPELKAVALAFVNLQEARHAADYDLSRPLDRVEALAHIEQARQAFADWRTIRLKRNAGVFLAALLFENRWKSR